MGTAALDRKAGNTKAEALRNRTRISLEVEQLFQQKRGLDPIGTQFTEPDDPDFELNLSRRLKQVGLTQDQIDSVLYGKEEVETQRLTYQPVPRLEGQLKAALSGTESYQ